MKKALFLLLDEFSDWEIAYLSSIINSNKKWMTKRVSVKDKVKSIGGNKWNIEEKTLLKFIEKAFELKKPIGAICGAVDYLAKNGFLNNYKHTGNSFYLWNEFKNYENDNGFVETQAITDGNLVTANGTGEIEFTEKVLRLVNFDTPTNIDKKIFMIKNGFYEYCKKYGNPYN
ncbi:glutamine amidotransferase [Staphylococcus epidermidis]|uniref:DJ-1/PfpI family protein n=1 Tax=Staphylococcus epidermidis TaxID=1282 RepID=UPI0019317D7B|nr:DJ-1/PfpI family protein [Staphylococcus epidermidis]MBM0783899.1 glutamine amidotransferase [Staphylococcus epidermidis]MBM0813392.1 glutamine amidotransferase [Staphylococcus epidermidis]